MNNSMSISPNPVPALVKEYKEDFGIEVEIYYHNSPVGNLDIDNFKYRPVNVQGKPAWGRGPGIFTHTGDEYFNKFGGKVYAVVAKKGTVIIQMEDDVSNKVEVFIPMNRVLEIVEL